MATKRTMLVTSALPYANGDLHLGHLVEHIQTDVWVRVQKILGNQCISICGIDAHGTPIMLKAANLGISPEELTLQAKASHEADFADFYINYDNYYTTHSPENKALSEAIYQKLEQNGDIFTKEIVQMFDPEKEMFLPDRYVKGTCPKCKAPDQYGDNCEACGATYSPAELINPVSAISNSTPVEKESLHYFFDLPKYKNFLQKWINEGALQPEISNKLKEWFASGLKPWNISRDAPYFGFKIPNSDNKYFYVWLDAPIGYMASFKNYCEHQKIDFDEFWNKSSPTELYHFVGKDIIYFHTLFWPAILNGSGYRLPNGIFAHGFLTIDGQKMSKSRGTFIKASTFKKHINPEYLRYYFATRLNGSIADIDLRFKDFIQRVNAELIGKVINIASRCAGFINKRFDNQLANSLHQPELYQSILEHSDSIYEAYLARNFAKAISIIMNCADLVNQYIDSQKPWILAKDSANDALVQSICTTGLNLFRVLMTYLAPVLPETAAKSATFLNCRTFSISDMQKPLLNHTIETFKPLLTRIEEAQIQALITETKSDV